MEIIPNVHLIRDSFVNLYLIAEPDGLTLIDAGMGSNGRKALMEVRYAYRSRARAG